MKTPTTDNHLLNRGDMAICCRVLVAEVPVTAISRYSGSDLQHAKLSSFPLFPVVSQAWCPKGDAPIEEKF